MRFWKQLAVLMFLLLGSLGVARAEGERNLEPIGAHFPIFRFEKNENPENILIGYTQLDPTCHFKTKNDRPILDYYWLLDGARFKDPHPLIKWNIRKRLQFVGRGKIEKGEVDAFDFKITGTKELQGMASAEVRVVSSQKGTRCEIETVASVSKEGGKKQSMALKIIRAETKKTFLPPFRKLVSITLEGQTPVEGQLVTRTFK